MKLAQRVLKLLESIFNPPNSLNISRADMPQIEDENQQDFLNWMDGKGFKHKKTKMSIKDMTPAQNELSTDAAKALLDSKSPKLNKPIIVSRDGYILDGHHRWFARKMEDDKQRVDVIEISGHAKPLIEIMRRYPKVKFKDIKNRIK